MTLLSQNPRAASITVRAADRWQACVSNRNSKKLVHTSSPSSKYWKTLKPYTTMTTCELVECVSSKTLVKTIHPDAYGRYLFMKVDCEGRG